MNRHFKIASFSLAALAFLLSPGSGSLRQVASCEGGLDGVIAPSVPFGTDFFSQLGSAAYKQNQSYWFDYLGKASSNFQSMRQSIRNSYGLDMPAGYQNPFTTPLTLLPSYGGGVLASNSPAFSAFMPLASLGSTNAFTMPTGALFAQPGAGFGGAVSTPSVNMAFGAVPVMASGAYPASIGAAANMVSFQR